MPEHTTMTLGTPRTAAAPLAMLLFASVGLTLVGCSEDKDEGEEEDEDEDASSDTDTGEPLEVVWESALIDFDELDIDAIDGDEYEGVLFSTEPSMTLAIVASTDVSPLPNWLCTSDGEFDCSGDLTLSFPGGVRELRFDVLLASETGDICAVTVSHGDGEDTMFVEGTADQAAITPVDLSAYTDVTELQITDIEDFNGLGFDTFAFEYPTVR